MSLRYAARTRPGTMVSTWLNSLVSGTVVSNAGYFAGGKNAAGAVVATVDRFAFPTDSRTTLGTGLSSARRGVAGMANSGTAGYVCGGSTGSYVATVDKFAFSDDGRTTLGTGLSAARAYAAGMANSGTAGYVGGGFE